MTTSDHILPENDQDLILARQLGAALESEDGLSAVQDPLIGLLAGFKQEEQQVMGSHQDTVTLWERIDRETRSRKPAKVLPLISRPLFRFAVAATILIAAFSGIFWYSQQPRLVGESYAQVATVALEDGTSIILRPYTRLYALRVNDHQRSYRMEGEAYFNVTRDANRPFSIEAGKGTVTVLGTRFNLSTWGSATHLYLEEGKVRFDAAEGSLELQPGQSVRLADGIISRKDDENGDSFKDWISQTLLLENTSVEQTFFELEQHYNISIEAGSGADLSETLGGSIQLSEVDSTLNDLAIILSGSFRKTGDRSYLFIPLN